MTSSRSFAIRSALPLGGLLLCFVLGIVPVCSAQTAQVSNSLELTLPSEFYAVPGVEMSIYFDNVVLTNSVETLRFQVTCDVGEVQNRRWSVTPSAQDVGTHRLTLHVNSAEGERLANATTTLQVIPADAGAGHALRLLIVGDSLTHASLYPNEIARLFALPRNPRVRMLGTHRPKQAAAGVAHEGYGGWTWKRFVSQYEPEPDGTHRKRSSPFVYLGDDKQPRLDVKRYLREECDGQPPDMVVFLLGINDCFSAAPDDRPATDARIEAMFDSADELLGAFHLAAPKAALGVCVTTPPNAREAAFQANYGDRYTRWGWKNIQHRLVQRQLARFAKAEQPWIFLIPTQLNLDPIDGYPENNGVHPNALGYQQMGASIFAGLKSRLTVASP